MNAQARTVDYTELSREVSYALRHAPEQYGLTLDEEGWTETGELLSALRKQERYKALTEQDLSEMIVQSAKKRHELADGRIRALYGHTVPMEIKKIPARPPEVLYHATARRFLSSILEQGLKPMQRQHVHLTEDAVVAAEAGRRRDAHPVMLRINAAAAWKDGVAFYHGNESVWLSDALPPKYFEIVENSRKLHME